MRKEVLFAILAGGIFGLIVAFGIWRLNSTISKSDVTTQGSPTPSPSSYSLTIAKPNENQVVTDSLVTVSGITTPNSKVVVSGEKEDYLTFSDSSGEFSQDVDLSGGINNIKVFVFDDTKKIAEDGIKIVYSSEFEKYLASSETKSETNASSSAEDIKNKVEEKVKDAEKKPVFDTGTVTDIAESTIQIKLESGDIEQAQVDDDSSFVSVNKETKTIEFKDVAIGDFIIAMGFKNGNGVLDAKRIIVTTIPETFDNEALMGTAQVEGPKEITLTSENQEKKIIFGKTWKGPDLNKLEDGQTVIVVGEKSEDLTARTLFADLENK